MKKMFILTLLISHLSVVYSYAQNPGFKIYNKTSSIKDKKPDPKATIIRNGKTENVYVTVEISRYNYIQRNTALMEDTIKNLNTLLNDNSTQTDISKNFSDDSVNNIDKAIQVLESKILKNKAISDSLYYLYVKDYLSYKKCNKFLGSIRSQAFFDIVSGNSGNSFRALGNTGLNFGSNAASIYSELISGTMGPFRIGLGAMISKSSSTDSAKAKKEEAYQRLVSNGGNTVLNIEYPLLYAHSRNNQFNFISTLNIKGTADLPAFGTDTSEWAGSGSFGINLFADASTKKNEITFFANLYLGQYYGTDVFQKNLGIGNSAFSFGQFSAGLVFLNNFKISFVIATLSSEKSLRNKNVIVGGQVLR